jgi:hypothetical protein
MLAGQVGDRGRPVRPRDVVVEIAPCCGNGAARPPARSVDGRDVRAHRGGRSIRRRVELEGTACRAVDEHPSPRRVVVEHDLARVLGGDPAVAGISQGASVRPTAVVKGTTIVTWAGRRPMFVSGGGVRPSKACGRPAPPPFASSTRRDRSQPPAISTSVIASARRESRSRASPACRAARATASARSIAAMILSASLTTVRTPGRRGRCGHGRLDAGGRLAGARSPHGPPPGSRG